MIRNSDLSSVNGLLIFLPTYNERENVVEIVSRIKALDIVADILFVDDNSPDGTGIVLNRLAQQEKGVAVIHRNGRCGIGSAHLEALRYACQKKYELLITMDADMTHAPEDIPRFLENAENADVVVGSRFLAGAIDQRGVREKMISRMSHLATTFMLSLPWDVTNAFRLYRLDRIDSAHLLEIRSDEYSFFFESLLVLKQCDNRIMEIPVKLSGRFSGRSKMGFRNALRWAARLMTLRWGRNTIHGQVV